MQSTFINPVVNPDAPLGMRAFDDTEPLRLWPNASESDVDIVIRGVYRQVLGNAHVMESERLAGPESQLKSGEISVRDFVRQVATSELYQSRFFDNCYRYRAIELNFKHLLGRAPDSFEEMQAHSAILDEGGFAAEIASYLDGEEYQQAFGENMVPYYRGFRTQVGQSMLGFTNMFQLLRSVSSSDKDLATNQRARLTRSLIQKSPQGIRKASEVVSILSQVFPSTPAPATPVSVAPIASLGAVTPTDPNLQQTVQAQKAKIAELQAQLADLRPMAAMGAAIISQSRFGSSDTTSSATISPTRSQSFNPLQRECDDQAAQIQGLTAQLAEARSLSAISDYKLNKWRSRSFNR